MPQTRAALLASFCLGRQWVCALVVIPWSSCNGDCGCRAQFASGRSSCRSSTEAVSSKVSDAALTRLRCLFISCCSFSFCSILTAADFVVNLHTFRWAAKASRSVGAISSALRSRLQTSLYRRFGLPSGLEPVASSPYSISFGILPSSMRATWPSQRSLLFARILNMLGIPARVRASSLLMCCCQEIPRIRLMHRWWKVFSLCSCLEERVQHWLPYMRVLRTQAWYTAILVLVVSLVFSHTLLDRRPMVDEALPILPFSSKSRFRLLEMMEPR